MRIGIEMNGILRDTLLKFRQLYEKFYVDPQLDITEDQEKLLNIKLLNQLIHLIL